MREILFRGKRKDNGEWVTGDLIYDKADVEHRIVIEREYSTGVHFCGIAPRIITETIGQFTGLTDKNGKKIFEGDIVNTNIFGELYRSFEIVWHSSGFRLKSKECKTLYDYCVFENIEFEIIGNAHESPELLEAHHE